MQYLLAKVEGNLPDILLKLKLFRTVRGDFKHFLTVYYRVSLKKGSFVIPAPLEALG